MPVIAKNDQRWKKLLLFLESKNIISYEDIDLFYKLTITFLPSTLLFLKGHFYVSHNTIYKNVATLKRKNYMKMGRIRKVYDNKNYMGCVIVKYPISVRYYSENVKCPNFNANVC